MLQCARIGAQVSVVAANPCILQTYTPHSKRDCVQQTRRLDRAPIVRRFSMAIPPIWT